MTSRILSLFIGKFRLILKKPCRPRPLFPAVQPTRTRLPDDKVLLSINYSLHYSIFPYQCHIDSYKTWGPLAPHLELTTVRFFKNIRLGGLTFRNFLVIY